MATFLISRLVPVAGIALWLFTGCGITSYCGNGRVENGEDCDGDKFAPIYPKSCLEAGYNGGGERTCTSSCKLDNRSCEATGRCGDGIVTEGWEECDGENQNGATCESLGHYGGVLVCDKNCRFDVSGCQRCGDGILQSDQGELVENGVATCRTHGYFGGNHHTEDCVTFHPETCSNHLLTLSDDPPVQKPTLGVGPEGQLWIHGLVHGAFEGFSPSKPGCPRFVEYYESYGECGREEFLGYNPDPECNQGFIVRAVPGSPMQPVAQIPEGSYYPHYANPEVQHVLPMTEDAVALIQYDSKDSVSTVQLFSADGTEGPKRTLLWTNRPHWSVERLQPGFYGLAILTTNGPWFFHLEANGTATQFHKGSIRYLGQDFSLNTNQAGLLPTHWESPWTVSFLQPVYRPGIPERWTWIRIPLEVENRLTEATHMFPLQEVADTSGTWAPDMLRVDAEAQTLTVIWQAYQTYQNYLRIAFQKYSWQGVLLDEWTYDPGPGETIQRLFAAPDGGTWLAGSRASSHVSGPRPDDHPTCSDTGNGYFATHLDQTGNHVKTHTFLLGSSYRDCHWYVSPSWASWAIHDGQLHVASSHSRATPFCHSNQPVPTYRDSPLFICDIHVVRFDP